MNIVGGSVEGRYLFDGIFRVSYTDLIVYSGAFYENLPCFGNCFAADIV